MVPLVSAYIEHFTYAGLFAVLVLCGLGLPVPEDVALLAGGYLVHRAVTRYSITLVISLVGVVSGDCSLFFLGRRYGPGVLRYLSLLHPHSKGRIRRLEGFMRRHGHRTIFYARFLAGLRALIYLTAGSLGVPPRVFLAYDTLGAAISVPIVVSLGYLFGSQLEIIAGYLGGLERLLLIVVGLCLLVWLTRMVVPLRERDNPEDSRAEAG